MEKLTKAQETFFTINRNEQINTKDVISLRGDANYTTLYLSNGSRILISYTLKRFEDLLPSENFIRPNKSTLLNTSFIKSHTSSEVVLKNQDRIKISRRRKTEIAAKLSTL